MEKTIFNDVKTAEDYFTSRQGLVTLEELKAYANQVSVHLERPAGSITLLYGGGFGGGVGATAVAENIGAQSQGAVRTIGQTVGAEVLESQAFRNALYSALGPDRTISQVDDIIYGPRGSTTPGLFDVLSRRFVEETAGGKIVTITAFSDDARVFARTELPYILESGKFESVNNIPIALLRGLYDEQLSIGKSPLDAAKEVKALLDVKSAELIAKINLPVAVDGSIAIQGKGKGVGPFIGTEDFLKEFGLSGNHVEGDSKPASSVLVENLTGSAFLDKVSRGRALIDGSPVLSALERGTATVTQVTANGVAKVGTAFAVIDFALTAQEVNAAVKAGDSNKAVQIGAKFVVSQYLGMAFGDTAAGWLAGGISAAAPFGQTSRILLGLTGGVGGGIAGDHAAGELVNLVLGKGATADQLAAMLTPHRMPVFNSSGVVVGQEVLTPTSVEDGGGELIYHFANGSEHRVPVAANGMLLATLPNGTEVLPSSNTYSYLEKYSVPNGTGGFYDLAVSNVQGEAGALVVSQRDNRNVVMYKRTARVGKDAIGNEVIEVLEQQRTESGGVSSEMLSQYAQASAGGYSKISEKTTSWQKDGGVKVVTKLLSDGSRQEVTSKEEGGITKSYEEFFVNDQLAYSVEKTVTPTETVEIKIDADGSGYRKTTNADGTSSKLVIESYAQRFYSVVNDAASLLGALRSGQPLPQLVSGLKLANSIDAKHSIPGLNTAASIGSAALSIYYLANALKNGDALDKISATANTIYAVASAAQKLGSQGLANEISEFFAKDQVGKAILPSLNLIQSIKNNDAAGAAMSAIQLFGPAEWATPVGWVYTIYQLSKVLKDTPHAWGVGEFKFGPSTDLTFDVSGEGFGKDKVSLVMQGNGKAPTDPEYFGGLKGYLDGVIASANQLNPQEPLGLIPQRLPSLVWREAREGSPGYEVKDFDPLTGQPKRPELRYDDKFQLIQAFGTAPEDKYNLMERLITSAMERGAIAPMWEVKTAKLQEQNNIRMAGLSEIEHAAREGLLARNGVDGKPSTGAFRPVALDLDGDGKITVESKAGTTRAFNWDDTGYLKASGWVGKGEGLLFLDRLPNGVVDSGVELFSNSKLADAAKGVNALAWVDANGDGRLNAADPVFNELRIWQDANADGVSQSSELKKLAELGITELNYAMNRFTRNGQIYSMSSPDLETSDEGIRQSVTPDGIKVEFSDGTVKVYASRVNDKSLYPGVSSIDNASTVEGGAADFLVRLNAPGAGVTRVSLGVFGSTASASGDLNLPMQASFDGGKTFQDVASDYVDVPAGLMGFTLRVRTKDDTEVESAETFTVQATTSANLIPAIGTGTIIDNDVEAKPLVSISGPVWVNEESDATAVYAVTLSKTSTSTVSVQWRTVDGSAFQGEDYVNVPATTVQFAPGETVKYVSVKLINDTLVEGTESYSVRLESPVGADLGVSQVNTTIQSGDVPPAAMKVTGVTAVVASVAEGEDAKFRVSLNQAVTSTNGTVVGLQLSSGTATADSDFGTGMLVSFDEGSSYAIVSGGTVLVPKGKSSFLIKVPTLSDSVLETDERFSLGARTANDAAYTSADVLIRDVPVPLATLSAASDTVSEGGGSITYTVKLSAPATKTVTIGYGANSKTATLGSDFSVVNQASSQPLLVFAPGETQKTFQVNIAEDAVYEGPESFEVVLTSVSDGARLGAVTAVTTTISDNDVAPVPVKVAEVTATVASVAEGEDAKFLVSLNQAVPNADGFAVSLQLNSGTATAGSDFSAGMLVSFDGGSSYAAVSAGSVRVPKGASSFLIKVPTLNDSAVEVDERFSLGARTINDSGYLSAEVAIRDVPVPQATLSAATDTVSEGGGSITYTVKLSGPATKTVTIGYGASSKTATLGSDFSVVNQASSQPLLVFAPGETQKTFQVNIAEDAVFEGPETFEVALTSVSDGAQMGPVTSLVTTISDNDAAPPPKLVAVGEQLTPTVEDTPVTVYSVASLLANDSFGSSTGVGAGLTLLPTFKLGAGVSSVLLNGENVEVRLQKDFNGTASFSYTVKAPDGQTAEATATAVVTPVDDPTQIEFVPDVRNIYGWGALVTKKFGGQQWNYTVEPDQGEVFYAPYQTIGGRVSIDNGDSSYWSGSIEDSGIPMDFALAWINRLGYNEDNTAVIEWKGRTYLISSQYGSYLHDTVVTTEVGNDGRLVVSDVDAEDAAATFVIESINVLSPENNGRIDSFGGLNFNFTGIRYVVMNPATGDAVHENIYTDSHLRGDPVGTSLLDVTLVNANGKKITKTISVAHFGPPPSPDVSSGGKPIAIDLDGNGFSFTDVDDASIFFDVNGDGWRRKTAWLNPKDGFLVYDKNSDGKITDRDELSFASYLASAQSDLEGLKFFDTNKDGVFSADDDAWSKFKVWRDANSNGVTDAGELMTLESLGIAKVELESDKKLRVINGQSVLGLGRAVKTDGTSFALADVILRYSDTALVTPPGGGTPFETVIPKNQPNQTIDGGAGNDLILGGTGNDLLRGGDGNDVFNDDEGSDHVQAGAGDDAVFTGRDNDFVEAGAGNDQVFTGVGNDVVFGEEGNDTLFLEGGDDLAFGGAGNDLIAGGNGNDALSGDDGDDVLLGEAGCDALFGKDGNDELRGMADGDVLYGDAGDDMLYGGAGDDTMEGGTGNDTYEVDSAKDVIVERADEGIDTVLSSITFSLGETGNLENLTLAGEQNLEGTGNSANNRLIGNIGRNVLTALDGNDTLDGGLGADVMRGGKGDDLYYVDQSGDVVEELTGEGTDTVIAKVDYTLTANVENLTLAGTEATIGTGNALNNVLTGNQWDNTLDGAAGADTMKGGLGNDTYVVDDLGDQVLELAGEGFDTVKVVGLSTYTLVANAEALVLGAGAVNGVGNELGNSLSGNELANVLDGQAGDDRLYGNAGADTLVGGDGNDLLDGGDGADVLRGGAGDDQYVVQDVADLVEESEAGGTDTVRSGISYRLTANVENLVLTGSAAINATGNALANKLQGNAADNVLDGAAGADEMRGGLGHDTYYVDDVGDQTLELAGQGHDQVFVSGLREYTLQAYVEDLTLGAGTLIGRGNELGNRITGNNLGDTLIGLAGNDTLTGGTGNDTLTGGEGDDQLAGGAGNDVFMLSGAGDVDGLDQIDGGLGSNTVRGVDNATDVLRVSSNLANLKSIQVLDGGLGGALTDAILGTDQDDVLNFASLTVRNFVLDGGAGNDTLTGTISADRIRGGLGNDVLLGGAGDDEFLLQGLGDADGLDSYDGGTGRNTIRGVDNATDVLRVSSNLANLKSIQVLDGGLDGALTDAILGTDQDDVLNFASLTVRNFVLDGGAGNDTLTGTAAADRIRGGRGNDVLFGGAADDEFLLQGLGDADGLDSYDGGSGRNRIRGVDQAADVLRVSDKLANLKYIQELDGGLGSILDNRILGTDLADTLNFSTLTVKNFVMDGGDGNDTITGTAANDWLQGGRGDDVLNGGDGDDTFLLQGLGEAEGLDQYKGGNGNNRILGADDRADVLYVNSFMSNLDKIYTIDGGRGGLLTDRLVGTSGDDYMDFSIRLVRNMVIEGGDGDDYIVGCSAVGEHIRGGRGNDVLFGGQGEDTYYWSLGDGNDQILDGLDATRIVLDGGVLMSMVSLQKSGTKILLEVTDGATTSTLTLDLTGSGGATTASNQVVIEGRVYDLNLDTATLALAAQQEPGPASAGMVPGADTGLLNRWSALGAPATGGIQLGLADLSDRADSSILSARDPLLHLGGPDSGINRISRRTAL